MSDSLQPHGLYPPGSSLHGIFQARVLEWGAISFSRRSSWPRDQTRVSCLQADASPSGPPGEPSHSRLQADASPSGPPGKPFHSRLLSSFLSSILLFYSLDLDHSAFIPSKHELQGLPWDSRAKTPSSNAGGSGSMPGQGSRSHIPQLRIHTSRLNIQSASAKTQHSQIDKWAIKKNKA